MFSCRTDGEDGASDCDVSDGAKLGIDAGDMLSGGSDGGPGDISAVETIDRYLALGVESDIKYEGFVRKQIREIDRVRRYEEAKIPDDFSYDNVPGLLTESRQKLKKIRPSTLGGASRISGVTPADVSVLAMYLLKSG
jgi:tRNA uridine 5-carboxymethylaminomethyl modification enzyme